MNKNKKRIIFSSISIILMLALISGTLAWFFLNEEAVVNYGNSIFCEAGDSLEISLIENGSPTRWSSSIDYSAGEFTTVDISGDGYKLYRPGEINEEQQPIAFQEAVSSLENKTAFDFIEMEVSFRSLSKMNVYLSSESFIKPVTPGNSSTNIYGNFSRDYIAGAMRVAVVDEFSDNDFDGEPDVKMVWAPNSNYQLIKDSNGSYSFKDGENNNSTPETSYSYFAKDEDGRFVEKDFTTDEYASKKVVIDSTNAVKGFSGKSPVLVSLNPTKEGEFDTKTVKIRIWFEGTDREADQALAGGNVNVKLKFLGINKAEAGAGKQSIIDSIAFDGESTFTGLDSDMVFSIDGRNWNKYINSSSIPTLGNGSSIYFKYPETDTSFETKYKKFTKID